jgi:hypothetical protein
MQTETQKKLQELALAASVNNTAGRTGLANPDRGSSAGSYIGGAMDEMGNMVPPSDGGGAEIEGQGLKAKKRKPRKKADGEKKAKAPRKRKGKAGLKDLLCGAEGAGLIGQGLLTEHKLAATDGSQNHGVGATVAGASLVNSLDANQGQEAPKAGSGMKKKTKRAPSAYNLFVRKFAQGYKGANLLKDASTAWKHSKSK